MAAVAASKPPTMATKMKKPSLPTVQTSSSSAKPGPPSASPSSAAKRLPGQATPQSATNSASATVNGSARPNRRPHRISTRTGTSEMVPLDKKAAAKKCAEPYVPTEPFILKKFKGKAPSLIVHLHPTHFRFDQQDGSFSYQSEMRIFIEHLQKKTIPHDMLEELRKAEVQFYDGWLIVRIVDHKTVAQDLAGTGTSNDDEKPFSIHNHNNFITPSPYAPYPTKEQRLESAKLERQGSASKDIHSDLRSDDTIDVLPKSTKPQPKVYHIALRPTELSRHVDMTLDAMAPDPKALNRKQSQIGSRTPASAQPPTPIGTIPSTPGGDKPPPAKKQKLKIDPRDFLEYEARVINSTAPPLFLDLVSSLDEAEQLMVKMKDPWHDAAPPSPRSRKRTVAELAADDAHAKEQERFMLIMDERNVGSSTGANAAGVDGQTGSGLFQPRFEKFNALDNIKREMAEKKQREKERQTQEEEARRGQQQQQEEERRRMIQAQQMNERRRQQAMQQQQQAHAAAISAQRQQAQAQRVQANSIPPQMQTQMTAAQASSPIIRQGTPHAASSPVVNNSTGGIAMVSSGSQPGVAGSPPRPGSAVQHGHPGALMARGPSNQGVPSRNGTPQLGHNTPGMRNSTPVMRQSTPTQHMTQASPHSSMAAPTPQMTHAGVMAGLQMPNGIARQNMTPQQLHAFQRHQQMLQQQQIMNGQPQPNQIAQMRAQQQAQAQFDQQNAAMQRQQQQQQQAMQLGNAQGQQMPQSLSNAQMYKAQLAKQQEAQLQNVQQNNSNHGSPAPNQMTPQQQQQLLHQRQMVLQQQQQQSGGAMGQQRGVPVNPQVQRFYAQAQQAAYARLMQEAAQNYGGNPSLITIQEKQRITARAHEQARFQVQQRQRVAQQANMNNTNMMARQQPQQQGAMGGHMQNGMGGGGQVNPGMAAVHQRQAAQMMQQQQMQNAQNMMAQQQQQQYQQQLNMMQQQHQGGQR